MGFLMFLSRKINLQYRENDINYQLAAISAKLADYTKYASILQQDSISIADVAEMPASLFGQGLTELSALNQQAAYIAGNQMNQAMSSGIFGADQNLQVIAQQKMYENARKELQKQLLARMNEEEKSLQAKQTRLETELAIVQQDIQACSQQIGQGVKNQISTYGLNG